MSELEGSLHIDLFNMEDEVFDGCPYILTSPRSLEACSRLGIKHDKLIGEVCKHEIENELIRVKLEMHEPVELLRKPLADFHDDIKLQGLSSKSIYNVYCEHERERQNKLHLCIEQREQITKDTNNFKNSGYDIDPQSYTNVTDADEIQRARTAWTASIGHNRVTEEELSKRALELHQRGKSLTTIPCRKRSVSRKLKKSNLQRNSETNENINNQFGQITQRASERVDNLMSSVSPAVAQAPCSARSGRRSVNSVASSDDVLSVKSEPSRKSCLKEINAVVVADQKIRDKLGNCLNPSTKLRAKDQKILSLMLAKHETEENTKRLSESYNWQWEEERKYESEKLKSEENKRRLNLSRHRQKLLQIQTEMESTRKQKEEQMKKHDEEKLNDKYTRMEETNHKIHLQKMKKLQERQMQELEKIKSMNEKREIQRNEMRDYQNELLERQMFELERAHSLKLTKEQQEVLKTKSKNLESQQKHSMKMQMVKRKSLDDLNYLRKSLEFKSLNTEKLLSSQRRNRQMKIWQRQQELDKKIEQSRSKQKQMEEEVGAWQQDLCNYRNMMEKQAELTVKQNMTRKSRTASAARTQKELIHRETMKKLAEEKRNWKEETEAAIAMKESRIQSIKTKREKMVQESRSLAGVSQRLREELKRHYSMNDLDQLNKHTQLEHRIIFKRPPTIPKTNNNFNSHNISTLLIG